MSLLTLENISIRFGNDPYVVREASFTVEAAKTLAVVGETGSGKSVILLAMLGLLPPEAETEGAVYFENQDLLSLSKKHMQELRGRKIAYIPQGSGNSLNPLLKVGWQLAEVFRRQGATRRESASRAEAALEQFGFSDCGKLCKQYPFMLSGGMRQRVLIAMGLVGGATIILADEPTKGLDSHRIEIVKEAFRKIRGRTILCVTHDLNFAKEIADRIVVMYASALVEEGDTQELFESPLHPYTQAMLYAMPENGMQVKAGFAPPRTAEANACPFYHRCVQATGTCGQAPPLVALGDRKVRCWLYAD